MLRRSIDITPMLNRSETMRNTAVTVLLSIASKAASLVKTSDRRRTSDRDWLSKL